jgi:hypothetical protein
VDSPSDRGGGQTDDGIVRHSQVGQSGESNHLARERALNARLGDLASILEEEKVNSATRGSTAWTHKYAISVSTPISVPTVPATTKGYKNAVKQSTLPPSRTRQRLIKEIQHSNAPAVATKTPTVFAESARLVAAEPDARAFWATHAGVETHERLVITLSEGHVVGKDRDGDEQQIENHRFSS